MTKLFPVRTTAAADRAAAKPARLPRAQPERGLKSGNVVVNGHRTSIRLEPEMWSALYEIARAEGLRVNALVSQIAGQARTGSLTSAIRVFIMAYFRGKATG